MIRKKTKDRESVEFTVQLFMDSKRKGRVTNDTMFLVWMAE